MDLLNHTFRSLCLTILLHITAVDNRSELIPTSLFLKGTDSLLLTLLRTVGHTDAMVYLIVSEGLPMDEGKHNKRRDTVARLSDTDVRVRGTSYTVSKRLLLLLLSLSHFMVPYD